jgi:hypothetical protein
MSSGFNFGSFAAFGRHLEHVVKVFEKGLHGASDRREHESIDAEKNFATALEKAAKVVEEAAKEKFGHYQPAVGGFGAWPELADTTQEERVKLGFSANDPLERTGGLRDSVTHEVGSLEAVIGVRDETIGSGTEADPTRNAGDVMIDMELGTRTVPPRPVLGPAAAESEAVVMRILERAAASIFRTV